MLTLICHPSETIVSQTETETETEEILIHFDLNRNKSFAGSRLLVFRHCVRPLTRIFFGLRSQHGLI